MILTERVCKWHYNAETGVVIGYRPKTKQTLPPEVRFHLTDQTTLGPNVVSRWWDKPPLGITYDNTQHSRVKTGRQIRRFNSDGSIDRIPETEEILQAKQVQLFSQKR